jgi:hypothetical protein
VVPAFVVPGTLLVLLQHLTTVVAFNEPAVRVLTFMVLYPLAYYALRDHRGPQRGGVALVVTLFLWLTNSLMTAAYPVLAVA